MQYSQITLIEENSDVPSHDTSDYTEAVLSLIASKFCGLKAIFASENSVKWVTEERFAYFNPVNLPIIFSNLFDDLLC